MKKTTRESILLFIFAVAFSLLMITTSHAEEFGLFDQSDIAKRHRIAAVTSGAVSMGLYELGVKPIVALPLSFGIVALAESNEHKNVHGMTASEHRMILFGSGVAFIAQKTLDYYEVPTLFTLELDGVVPSISKTWSW